MKLLEKFKRIYLSYLNKDVLVYIFIALLYLIFFSKTFLNDTVIYSGKDSISLHYQAKIYLDEKLKSNEFPFYTERMFLGFPIYADLEKGYLNPINVVLVYIFGPFNSYKILHFFSYFIGSVSLFYFLKKFGKSKLGFLASNVVYFFNFFIMYHQQHFNMVLTYYLLPFTLFLLQKIIDHNNFKYSIILSLVLTYLFYLGSFQMLFLILLINSLYMIIFANKNYKKYYLFVNSIILFLIFSLPGLFSVYGIFSESSRITSLKYTQGSFSPLMVLSIIFPFIFNHSGNYLGTIISSDYLMHETYIYSGIVTLILSIISFLKLKNTHLKAFSFLCIIIFMILTFGFNLPLFENISIPFFSLFRYWARSSVFLYISLSILTFLFFENVNKPIFKNNTVILIFFPIVLFIFQIIHFLFKGLKNLQDLQILYLLNRCDNNLVAYLPLYLSLVIICIIFIILIIKLKKEFVKPFFVVLLILDLAIFNFIAHKDSLYINKKNILDQVYYKHSNERILHLGSNHNGNNSLMSKSYSLLGYPVLYPKILDSVISEIGLSSLRYPILYKELNIELLNDLGISKVINAQNNIEIDLGNKNLIDQQDIEFINNNEGNISFNINNSESKFIKTKIRNYKGFNAYVNNKKVDLIPYGTKNEMFLMFKVNEGFNHVNIYYKPYYLLLGLKYSMISLTLYLILLLFLIKRKITIFSGKIN